MFPCLTAQVRNVDHSGQSRDTRLADGRGGRHQSLTTESEGRGFSRGAFPGSVGPLLLRLGWQLLLVVDGGSRQMLFLCLRRSHEFSFLVRTENHKDFQM